MRIAPAHERDDRGEQLDARQRAQPRRQRRTRNAQVARKLSVATYAEERLAKNQQRPLLAHERQRAADRIGSKAMAQVALERLCPHSASTSLPVFWPRKSLSSTAGKSAMSPSTTSSRETSLPSRNHCA